MFHPQTTGQILSALSLTKPSVAEISKVTGRSRAALYQLIHKDGDLRNLCLTFDQWQALILLLDEKLKLHLNTDTLALIDQVRDPKETSNPPA